MKIRKGVFFTGLLILLAGVMIGLASFAPAQWIQYVVAGSALVAGILAVTSGQQIRTKRVASRYMWVEGIVLIAYALAMVIFGSTYGSFINVTTLFLLVFAMVEFTLMLQSLHTTETPNWNVFAQKLIISAASAIAAVNIYASADRSNMAILFIAFVTMLIGAGFIRETRHIPV